MGQCKSEKMTQDALESCARGSMWTDYEPTPLTREWLEENNYLPHIEYEYEYNPYFSTTHKNILIFIGIPKLIEFTLITISMDTVIAITV